jgi:enoyl-CoA hydratase/carnithine racemase
MAKGLAQGPLQSYRLSKWAVYRGLEVDLATALEHETFAQNLLLGTEDVREAAKAFEEKRKPVFKGK